MVALNLLPNTDSSILFVLMSVSSDHYTMPPFFSLITRYFSHSTCYCHFWLCSFGLGASVLDERGSILGPGSTSSSLPLSLLPWQSGLSGFMGQGTGARKKAAALKPCKHPMLQNQMEEREAKSVADRTE